LGTDGEAIGAGTPGETAVGLGVDETVAVVEVLAAAVDSGEALALDRALPTLALRSSGPSHANVRASTAVTATTDPT
jgi:hypothetical protein